MSVWPVYTYLYVSTIETQQPRAGAARKTSERNITTYADRERVSATSQNVTKRVTNHQDVQTYPPVSICAQK